MRNEPLSPAGSSTWRTWMSGMSTRAVRTRYLAARIAPLIQSSLRSWAKPNAPCNSVMRAIILAKRFRPLMSKGIEMGLLETSLVGSKFVRWIFHRQCCLRINQNRTVHFAAAHTVSIRKCLARYSPVPSARPLLADAVTTTHLLITAPDPPRTRH